MTNFFKERRIIAMKKNVKNPVAKGVKEILDIVLKTEANSTSCAILYQPKAPKELEKFRRNK